MGFVDLEFIIIPTYSCSITKKGGKKDNNLKTINVLVKSLPSRLNKSTNINSFIGFTQAITLQNISVIKPTKYENSLIFI